MIVYGPEARRIFNIAHDASGERPPSGTLPKGKSSGQDGRHPAALKRSPGDRGSSEEESSAPRITKPQAPSSQKLFPHGFGLRRTGDLLESPPRAGPRRAP